MTRLVAFGCSLTYGHGLPDCAVGSGAGLEPSSFAWPKLLADKLNATSVNMSQPGSGNTEILWRLLNFNFQPDDICVIMWSYFIRAEYYRYLYDGNGVRIDNDKYDPRALEEEPMFTENNNIKNLLAMSHAAYHLNYIGIKSYACVGSYPRDKRNVKPWDIDFSVPNSINILNLDLTFYSNEYTIDKALDGKHPGVRSHERIAEGIYKKINVVC